jgi:Protein kinase domain
MEHPCVRGLTEWRLLARGGRSVVWAARQLTLDRPVAVKVYQRELDEGDRSRFLREAAAASLSDHPGIVTAHDAGILPDDRPYLIMDLCPGGSLTEWLKPENRPSEERVRQVGVRIADALAAVHAGGVLHRDVEPANILIDSFGNPGLADFALATVAGTATTAPDAVCSTPAYAPPEFEMQPATESGDVFSLAATLYALLAGRPPCDVGAAPVALEQTVEVGERPIGPIPRVNRYLPIPGVNRHLMDVLLAALSNDPVDRPTAASFRDQLAHVLAPGQLASAEAPRRRGKRRVAIAALAAALVTVTAPSMAWLISEPAPAALPVTVTSNAPPDPPSSSAGRVIQLENAADAAKPFQTVEIQGTYRGGADTSLRVQRWEGGQWLDFPLPTVTDQAGQFTAYVELGQPGRYRLRLLDPDSGVTSTPSELVIKS